MMGLFFAHRFFSPGHSYSHLRPIMSCCCSDDRGAVEGETWRFD